MKYLRRSAKYLLQLIVLFIAILGVMHFTGTLAVPIERTPELLMATWRGWAMLVAVVVLAALYPRFGFVERTIPGSLDDDRAMIVEAFGRAGFRLAEDRGEELHFRAVSLPLRLRLLFEDELVVRSVAGGIEVGGIRRGVARVIWRLRAE